MKYKFLILSFLFGSFCYANNVDSLITKLNECELIENDSVLYSLCQKISYKSNNPDVKLLYARKAIVYSKNWGNTKYIAGAKFIEATAYIKLGYYTQAIKSLYESRNLYESINDRRRVSFVLSSLGRVYRLNKQYQPAKENFNESINILNEILKTATFSNIFNNSELRLGATLINLGELYRKLDLNDSAIYCYREAIGYCKSNQSNLEYIKGNIGLVYVAQNKLDSAQVYLNDAIAYLEEQKDNYAVSSYLDGLAEVYLKQNLLQKSLVTSQKSLKLAEDYGLKEQIRDASLRLSSIYNILHNYQKALTYQKQYALYKDSISNEETTRQIANLQADYEIAQMQKEVDREKERKDVYQAIVIGFAFIALLLVSLLVLLLRINHKRKVLNGLLKNQKQDLDDANNIKNRFFSVLSHDLRSPLAAFCSYAEVLCIYAEDQDMISLEDTAEYLQTNSDNLLDMLDNLLVWGDHQMNQKNIALTSVNVKDLVQKEVDHLQNVANKKKIAVRVEIPLTMFLIVDKPTMSIAVRNLINNALKFTPLGGEVIVRGAENGNQITLEVADNGIGMSVEKLDTLFRFDASNSTYGTENEKGVGLGMQLIHSFVQSNNVKLTVDSELGMGSTFRMVFDKDLMR